MEEVSAPITGANKTVLFSSIGIAVWFFLLTIEADSQNQFPAFIWAYTAWKVYKQDFAALVTAQKFFVGAAALLLFVGTVAVGDAKFELFLGLSSGGMMLAGMISVIVHLWLLNFFKGQLPDVSRSTVANQELLEKEDNTTKIIEADQKLGTSKFCHKCGQKTTGDANFCTVCGVQLVAVNSTQQKSSPSSPAREIPLLDRPLTAPLMVIGFSLALLMLAWLF